MPADVRAGTTFVIENAQARAVADAIRRWEITDLFLPPTVIYNMLADPEIPRMSFPSLRYLLYGAAPMAAKIRAKPCACSGRSWCTASVRWRRSCCARCFAQKSTMRGDLADDQRLASCGRPAPFVRLAIIYLMPIARRW